jgi:hypothetical protein
MIIVITTLGLTTSELNNSANDTYMTGARPPIMFGTGGEVTTTATQSYMERSHGGPIFVGGIKPTSSFNQPSPTESNPDSERHVAAV